MKKVINAVAQTVTFTFDGFDSITLAMKDVSPANATYAMLHGFSARIGDNAAYARKQPDGSVIVVTEEMRRNAVKELVDHYESGTEKWEIKGTGRAPAQNPVIAGIATKRGITYAEAEAFLAAQFLTDMAA